MLAICRDAMNRVSLYFLVSETERAKIVFFQHGDKRNLKFKNLKFKDLILNS